ncbi:MAG: hypothetical protein AAB492_01255 [Patescibacteria group bacterium]
MSWVTTISGRRWIEGGQSVQPRGEENVYTHLHFDGNSSLNGATATLRGKGWIRDEDEVVVIRSCGFGQDDERPRGHLVVIKEKRASRPVHSVTEELVGWNALIKQIRSGKF